MRELWDVYGPWRLANLARKMLEMDVEFSKFSWFEPPDSPVDMAEISEVWKILIPQLKISSRAPETWYKLPMKRATMRQETNAMGH